MDDVTKIITTIFGTVVLIAIVAVVVSKKSQAPQAIQSIGSAVGTIVAAAVNPVSANYGYGGGSQAATTPALNIPSNATQLFDSGVPGL